MLKIEIGDAFNAIMNRDVVFCHGVNCQGSFGSGVAGLVKKNYPLAALAYKQHFRRHGLRLGQVIVAPPDKTGQPTVCHLATQEFYGRDGKQYASYDAIIVALQQVVKQFPDKEIHMPAIGCGLGGLDQKRVIAIIESVCYNVNATLWLVE